jgi:hypothetical protein
LQIEDKTDKYQKERRSQKEAGIVYRVKRSKRVEMEGERESGGGWEGRHGGKGEEEGKLEKLIN